MIESPNTIHRVNGYKKDAYTYYPVIVVGAGAAGIAMGCQLRDKLRFDQFRIFDRQCGIGGTWWINRYPGVAVDVPAVWYSFSFAQMIDWKEFYPAGPEIVKYMYDVCEKFEIVDKIQCNTDVTEMRWNEQEQLWEATLVHLAQGAGDMSRKERQELIDKNGRESVYIGTEKIKAKIVISGCGGLVEPKDWPDHIPGRESFEGEIFHSARWKQDADLKGKDVIVVGTGCSAAQLVGELTREPHNANSVTQLMRSPPWVVPKILPPFNPGYWSKWGQEFCRYFLAKPLRFSIFVASEMDFNAYFRNQPKNAQNRRKAEKEMLKNMKKKVPEKYHEILTPDYDICCKRRIFDAYWFDRMDDPKYHLTTQPLTKVLPKHVVIGPGRTYPPMSKTDSQAPTDEVTLPADAIILANGFDVTTWLHPLEVLGRDGKKLQDVWDERGGPQAYLGAAMDGFPNFFILFGPNTATGHSSVILAIENMVLYTLKFVRPILNGDIAIAEVKKSAEIEWTKNIQEELKDTVFQAGGCTSWYYTATGWNATGYPRSQLDFMLRCMFPKWGDWEITYTRKGLIKQRVRQITTFAFFAAALIGAYHARQSGVNMLGLPNYFLQAMRSGVLRILGTLRSCLDQVQNRI